MTAAHRWPAMDQRRVKVLDGTYWRFVPWLDTLNPVRMDRLLVQGHALRLKITARLKGARPC